MSKEIHVFFVSLYFSKTMQIVSEISNKSLSRVLSIPMVANDSKLNEASAHIRSLCLPLTLKMMESYQSPMAFLGILWSRVVHAIDSRKSMVDFGKADDMKSHFSDNASLSRSGEIPLDKAVENLLALYEEFLFNVAKKTENLVSQLVLKLESHELEESSKSLVLEQLQFQDRVRQILENLQKSMISWNNSNAKPFLQPNFQGTTQLELATSFLKFTTTIEERELLKELEPKIIIEEQVASDDFFF